MKLDLSKERIRVLEDSQNVSSGEHLIDKSENAVIIEEDEDPNESETSEQKAQK